MRVCLLFQSDFPPEPRLARTAKALLELGHEVSLFCDNRNERPHDENLDGLKVRRVSHASIRPDALKQVLRLPIFWNPVWCAQFFAFVRAGRFDAIHAINLTMAPLAWLTARRFGLHFVYDMYEPYPDALRSWQLTSMFDRVFRNATAAELLDRRCLRAADHVIVVVEEAMDYVLHMGVLPKKISVIQNVPDTQALLAQPVDDTILQRYDQCFTIVYTGMVGNERGLDTVVAGMMELKNRIPESRLVIVGGGPHEGHLRELARKLSVEPWVEFTGWTDHRMFATYIRAADVCIVPQPANPYVDKTLPNKLFDYMALGKPVVVSDAKPLARIVRACDCGEVFTSESPESFVEAVLAVKTRLHEAGHNGEQAVANQYNWRLASRNLAEVYARLSATPSTAS